MTIHFNYNFSAICVLVFNTSVHLTMHLYANESTLFSFEDGFFIKALANLSVAALFVKVSQTASESSSKL